MGKLWKAGVIDVGALQTLSKATLGKASGLERNGLHEYSALLRKGGSSPSESNSTLVGTIDMLEGEEENAEWTWRLPQIRITPFDFTLPTRGSHLVPALVALCRLSIGCALGMASFMAPVYVDGGRVQRPTRNRGGNEGCDSTIQVRHRPLGSSWVPSPGDSLTLRRMVSKLRVRSEPFAAVGPRCARPLGGVGTIGLFTVDAECVRELSSSWQSRPIS